MDTCKLYTKITINDLNVIQVHIFCSYDANTRSKYSNMHSHAFIGTVGNTYDIDRRTEACGSPSKTVLFYF